MPWPHGRLILWRHVMPLWLDIMEAFIVIIPVVLLVLLVFQTP
jgi:hypothetical protein